MLTFSIPLQRRAWLCAALVALFCASCATDNGATTETSPEVRVDVQWRLDLASDRGWEQDPREMGQPMMAPGGDVVVGASNGWVYRILPHSGEILWRTEIGGSVDAAAEVVGGTVYVGTDAGYLVALDFRDGEQQWRHETRGSVEMTPAVEGGRAYVTDSEEILYALDAATGEQLWEFQHEAPEFFTIKGATSPLVVDEFVYAGFFDGQLTALYADTGEEVWSVDLGDETGEFGDVDLPLMRQGDRIIAVSHAGGIYAVNRHTGAIEWHENISDVTGATLESGWLFATTATGRVFAFDTRDEEMYWEFEFGEDFAGMDVTLVGSYVAVATTRGPMYWLRLRTGEPVTKWAPSSGFQNAPVFDDRYGYVMSNRGYLYALGLAF